MKSLELARLTRDGCGIAANAVPNYPNEPDPGYNPTRENDMVGRLRRLVSMFLTSISRSGLVEKILVVLLCFQFLKVRPTQAQAGIQQLFDEAQAARARGDLEQAAHKYQELIRRDPQLVNAYHNLGIVYFSQGKYRDAIAVVEKALKLSPGLAGAHMILGLAYYELYESDKATAAFQEAHRSNPNDTNALFYLGKAQMQESNYRGAAETFDKLSQTRPNDPDVLYNLSLARMKLMLEAVNRLSQVASQSYQFWLWLAQDAEAHNNDTAAIQHYQEALRSKPDAVGGHYALGSAYAREGKYPEAAQEFKTELQINPNDSLALWKLGEMTVRTDPEEAKKFLVQAVSLDPEFAQARLAYGRALLRTGQIEDAVEQFLHVVRLAPEEDSVHYLLARAYRRVGREEQAKAELDRFKELARQKSDRRLAAAQQLVEMTREAQQPPPDLEPGFSPSRTRVHQ